MKRFSCFILLLVLPLILFSCVKNETYEITFESNGGTLVAKQFVEKGKFIQEPDDPENGSLEFLGWYEFDNFFGNPWNFEGTEVYQKYTLYAKWSDDPVEITKSQVTYLKDTVDEFTIYKYETNVEGPVFFIIGGIHGDERAGWMAAGEMLDFAFQRGTVYVLPQANKQACEGLVRYNKTTQTDLNRAFPGLATGTATQKLANMIFQAILERTPDIVIDLHESQRSYESFGYLGNSLICHDGKTALFVMEVLGIFNKYDMQTGQTPFTYLADPPVGSINRQMTEDGEIPVITVETNRDTRSGISGESNSLARRIIQQQELIKLILTNYKK